MENLFRATAEPPHTEKRNNQLIGSQADQKKFIGNAVEVTIARAWCEALCEQLSRMKIKNIAKWKKQGNYYPLEEQDKNDMQTVQ